MKIILRVGWQRQALLWIAAIATTALLTSLLLILHANATTSAILYLVLVVWFATLAGTPLSICVAVLCATLFDYFFLEPRYTFAIYGVQDWLALIAFIVSCVVVARVAEHARRQTRQAEQRRADVERLYSLSQEMMLHGDAQGLVNDIPLLVERIFGLDAVLLYVRDINALAVCSHGSGTPGSLAQIPLVQEPVAQVPVTQVPLTQALDQLYSSVPGHQSEPLRLALRSLPTSWENAPELPDRFVPIHLVFGMKTVGTLAWRPATLSREVATSIAAQVAIALTRAIAIEASTRLEAARASDRLRTALIDSLTHELRTPLTAIRAAASTLLASAGSDGFGLDAETRTELATIVEEESARLDRLIGQAIEMAQIDAVGIRVDSVPVHTRSVLDQAVEQSRPQLANHRVVIAVEGPDSPLWFDPHLIGRVLRHLLENAVSYTPPGTQITLRSRRIKNRESGLEEDQLEFSVEDQGSGISPLDLPLIFEKFYRGKRTSNTRKGSGMGLAIARAIVTAHHGSITAESQPGKGTNFRIQIPAIDKAPAPEVNRKTT